MTSPDPKILAAALVLAEEGLQVFRGIDDPEIKKEVVLNEAILAAAKAYQSMRVALEATEEACRLRNEGPFDEWWIADERARKLRHAALSKAGV